MMKRLLTHAGAAGYHLAFTTLVATISMFAGIEGCAAQVRIVDDPGGKIGTYMSRYEGLRGSGESVVIDGYCASACTMVLGSVPHDKICVTSRATLLFHAAYDADPDGRKSANAEATQILYSAYPSEIRHWIDQHGGLTLRAILLRGRELMSMFRSCSPGSRAASR
jgi:hypothetical protein